MENRFYIASDYAGIKTESVEFYYGYEVTYDKPGDEAHHGEWCFRMKKDGRSIRTVPSSQLTGVRDTEDCGECLLSGIMLMIQEAHLS